MAEKTEKLCGVYQIRCLKNKKVYVGSSKSLSGRWNNHRSQFNRGVNNATRVQKDWNRFGEKCFVFEILELCSTDRLREREQFWMNKKNSVARGYNANPSAKSAEGYVYPEEVKTRMKETHPKMFKDRSRRMTEFNKLPSTRRLRSEHFKRLNSDPEWIARRVATFRRNHQARKNSRG